MYKVIYPGYRSTVPYSPGIWICSDLLPHFLQQKICLDNSSSSRLPWLLFAVPYYQSYKTSLTIICSSILSVNYNFSSSRLPWLLLAVRYYQCYNSSSSSSRLPWLLLAVPYYPCFVSGSGIQCFFYPLDPWSGIWDKFFQISDLGSQTHISESLVTVFWVKNTLILCQLTQFFGYLFKNKIFTILWNL